MLRRYLNVDGHIYRPPYEGPVDDEIDEDPIEVTVRAQSVELIVSSLAIDESLAGTPPSSREALLAQADAMLTEAQTEARALLAARAADPGMPTTDAQMLAFLAEVAQRRRPSFLRRLARWCRSGWR